MDEQFEACVLHMLPAHGDDSIIYLLIQDLFYSITASSKDNVTKVLNHYGKLMIKNDLDSKNWSKLEIFARIMCDLPSLDEKYKYLKQCLSFMDDKIMPGNNLSEKNGKSAKTFNTESVYAESFENFEKISDRRSVASYTGGMSHHGYNDTTLNSLSDPYFSTMVPRADIIKSIPYLVLGIPSTLFEFKNKGFIIPSNIPNGESQQLHNLIEGGLLFVNISTKIDTLKKRTGTATLKVAFLTFIQTKLREYNNFVNQLSSRLTIDDPICYVYQHLYPEILKLRLYLSYLEKFDKLRGEQFLSIFESSKRNGDPAIEKIASEALPHLLLPYIENICNWLINGKLNNNVTDFFVELTKGEKLESHFIPEKIPSFIPFDDARRMYMIGKSLRYLEECCNEVNWINMFSKKYLLQYRLLPKATISGQFFVIVYRQYKEINAYINELLKTKYYYFETIELLKDLLLMGKGDFIDSIILNSSEFLKEPSHSLESYHLTKCLQLAVQQSSLKNRLNKSDNNLLINRLDARLLELGHGSIGWDVFTLDYLLDAPLAAVININQHGNKREYLRIFNFLWRIKKNNKLYEDEWQKNSALIKLFRKMNINDPFLKDLLRKVSMTNCLKNQIQSFNRKIEYYCFENIIQTSYTELLENIHRKEDNNNDCLKIKVLKSGAKIANGLFKPNINYLRNYTQTTNNNTEANDYYDIEELDNLHSEFLSAILKSPLLYSGTGANLGKFTNQLYPITLVMLLDSSYEFAVLYAQLNNVIHEIVIQLNLDQTSHNLHDMVSRFNLISTKLINQWGDFENECNAFIKDLKWDRNPEINKLSRILH